MSTRDPKRLSDGVLSLEAGVDSGRTPNLLKSNQASFAINATMRGGWPMPRPGYRKVILNFQGVDDAETAFKSGLFQTAGAYLADDGTGSLIAQVGGYTYRFNISNSNVFEASDITIPGDPGSTVLEQAWWCQAENYFIIQDGQSGPYIYNGAAARRATEKEIPTAKQMTYYMGRIWLASGRFYGAGDIVYGNGTRNNILNFTENDFLNEGGFFAVPVSSGDITGLAPMANLDTALGQGELIITTANTVFSNQVPQDRTQWKNTTSPLQRVVQINYGVSSQTALVGVNGDFFYRSSDGIRSLIFAVRRFNDWGNTPISNEMNRILVNDSQYYLRFASGVLFDNRMLMTTSPGISRGHGVYHRAICSMDFDLITSMNEKLPPAWEGIWTGLNILQLVKATHNGVERCFAFTLNQSNEIELWEITKDDKFDNDSVRIEWSVENRAMDFGSKFDQKELESADIFIDRLAGQVDVSVQYRPDSHPCWIPWDSWSDCAKHAFCVDDFGTCPDLHEYKEQYRPKRQLVQPGDTFDPNTNELYRRFFEFQTRIKVKGFCRLKQQRYNAYDVQESPSGRQL